MQPHSVLQKNQLPTPLSYLLHHNTFTPTQPGYVKSVPNHQRTRQKLLVYRRSRRVDFHSNVPLLKHSFQGTMHTIDSTLFLLLLFFVCFLWTDVWLCFGLVLRQNMTQDGIKFAIFLSQPPGYWDYRKATLQKIFKNSCSTGFVPDIGS